MAHNDHVPDLGQPNGIATLDGSGLIPLGQVPPSKVYYAESEGTTTTTVKAPAWVTKLTMSFTATAGDHEIAWQAEISHDRNSQQIEYQVMVDGSPVAEGSPNPDDRDDGYGPIGGFLVSGLTAGSHDVAIQFRSTGSNQDARMRRARVIAREVQQ